MLVVIVGLDGRRDFVVVYGVNLAGFGVALEEFLRHVFAGSEHVAAVEREVGEGSELRKEGGESGKGVVDGGYAGGEGGVVEWGRSGLLTSGGHAA